MSNTSHMNLDRWTQLMCTWGFPAHLDTFTALRDAYSEAWRFYHTAEHISACLGHLDQCHNKLDNPREVEIALWFHDAVYKPLSSTNEQESADWAATFLTENGAADHEVARVSQLIMATEHRTPAKTKDESILLDIDLSILGSNPSIYDCFEQAVRKEYKMVPWFLYRKKRAHILQEFLERPQIYTSGCFPESVERQAKENLSQAIAKLKINP